jgi:hypothetical protein
MSDYKIEKGIKIPKNSKGVGLKYPFDKLKVGDSFAVGIDEMDKAKRTAYLYARRHGIKIETRAIEGGARIWRTK